MINLAELPSSNFCGEPIDEHDYCKKDLDIKSLIKKSKEKVFINQKEILLYFQENIVRGRALDLGSLDEVTEGETNNISVDRDNILKTTFDEIEYISDFRLTFCVDFISEESVDLGGPRKEWLEIINREIYDVYFKNGLRELLKDDYWKVGVMIAIALLQNGPVPVLPSEVCDSLAKVESPSDNVCIKQLRKGLQKVGMASILCEYPSLLLVLKPSSSKKLKVAGDILQLLKADFSEPGSNAIRLEKECYSVFVKYVREVAAGRRTCGQKKLDLGSILKFVSGATEEPLLGFTIKPKITFVLPKENTVDNRKRANFAPSSHTCSNELILPRPTMVWKLPNAEILYNIYDLAFSSDFFGLR